MHTTKSTKYSILVLLTLFLFSVKNLKAQKRPIQTSDFYSWNSITDPQISTNGNLITYVTKPLKGDKILSIYSTFNNLTKEFVRVSDVAIQHDENFIAFKRINSYDSIRKLKLDDVPKKKWPSDTVELYLIDKDTLVSFPNSSSYTIGPDGGNLVAIERDKNFVQLNKAIDEKPKKRCRLFKKKVEQETLPKFDGQTYTFYNPILQKDTTINGITDVDVSQNGLSWAYIQKAIFNDSIDSLWVIQIDDELNTTRLYENEGFAQMLAWDEMGNQLALLFSSDTSEAKKWNLLYYSSNKVETIIDTTTIFENSFYGISRNKQPYFSKNGKRLFFGTAKKEEKELEDTLTKEEKYHLDLWSWTDGRLQSQQLLELKGDQKRTDLWVYNLEDKSKFKLSDSTIDRVRVPSHNNANYALVASQHPYLKEMTWDGWYYDYYRVDLTTGNKKQLLKHHPSTVLLSPSGSKLVYYEPKDSVWYIKDLENDKILKLETVEAKFYRKNHDTPDLPGPSGYPFWLENEQAIVLKSQYDYWVFPLKGGKPYRITNGKKSNTIFSLLKFDKDKLEYSLKDPIYFQTFNEKTKKEGVARYGVNGIEQLFEDESKTYFISKADSSDKVIMRQMTVSDYPELQLTDIKFTKRKAVSHTNPQQDSLNWATVELVSWVDYNNDSVAGLLYKPEDYDPSKKYPLIVYFYERYSDNIHYYYSPRPTASIIYPTLYASNGYLVFIPDIKYEIGHPAKSAYNSIMSGVDHLLKKYLSIDSAKMGLQGQSWGGYQTAQLITMTNRFSAAMAGAPVSNMFSAYGGIRWGSGHNRAFQYEKGQSRIGATIWESPELYIENSPIFHIPKVKTPLLIMHNDNDGAVPWYQGIEMFTAMRRLNKPVWMLNYNNDAHNLRRTANKIDLSIRMQQFFDYYLLGKPQPLWMKEGIPALEKGVKTKYELVD